MAQSDKMDIQFIQDASRPRAEAGCPMHFISEVLGHSSIEFTRKRYARFSPESASRAVLRVLEAARG